MARSFRDPALWDLHPLTAPVDRSALAAHRRRVSRLQSEAADRWTAEHRIRPGRGSRGGAALRAVLLVIALGAGAVLVYALVASLLAALGTPFAGRPPEAGTLAAGIAALALLLLLCVWGPIRSRRDALRNCRLDAFARANGGTHDPLTEAAPFPNAVFEIGDGERRVSRRVVVASPRRVEFGEYTDAVRGSRTGYIAIDVSVPLPPMVLEQVSGSALRRRTPPQYDTSHRLSLPPAFDGEFVLYAHPETAGAASELFDPDLLARLSGGRRRFEVETGGTRLLLFTRSRVATTDPEAWRDVLAVADAVIGRLEAHERRVAR